MPFSRLRHGFFGGGQSFPQNIKAENNFNEARVSSSVPAVFVGKSDALTAPRSEARRRKRRVTKNENARA